ncbi:circularly permuted type 2 ATP-grasp protein [Lacihabitans lacunae]|jgi:uncharacterized circularly permuted ATP-grasp superfamily protein|uniref:Circularly permuted type 2 ATP-grasp protein n=1 Tax=Lacihabitans lacunae TaxID=1028214 RepID=A0ABV7YUG2_9BACT
MKMNFDSYETSHYFDELVGTNKKPRNGNEVIFDYLANLSFDELNFKQKSIDAAMMNMGITFNVYSEEGGTERIIPLDMIPRVISGKDWDALEKGLKQRIFALNEFLKDIYSDQKILKDGIIPKEVVLSSKGFIKQCMGVKPLKDIFIHITGSDLIRDEKGQFVVLEDNLRSPSGVSYMLQGRELSKQILPNLISKSKVRSISEYPEKLFEALAYISGKSEPTIAVLTPGIYNSAYYEHSFLAQQMGVELVDYRDLVVENDIVKMKTTKGYKTVDMIYRRLDDLFLDPMNFNPKSMIGIPHLFDAYKKGNVGLANALGTGVADDKVVYAYVPRIIKYYLGEDPIIPNVETYLCGEEDSKKYVLENIEKLVVKEANEAGGYGMLIGPRSTKAEQDMFRERIKADPRNYIAQPTISLSTSPCLIDDNIEARHVDLRPYIIYGEEIYVTPGGLTRVALKKGSLVVNSSQGGGSKDTWVLKD